MAEDSSSKDNVAEPSTEPSSATNITGNTDCACACDVCYCGPDCRCTETLCRCEASSVLNSLSRSTSVVSNKSTPPTGNGRNKGSCCSGKTKQATRRVSFHHEGREDTNEFQCDPLAAPEHHPDSRTSIMSTQSLKIRTSMSQLATVEIGVIGMTCSMCTKSVTRAMEDVEAVASVSVSLATNSATVVFDSAKTTAADLGEAIEDIGYEVIVPESRGDLHSSDGSSQHVEFSVIGMTCSMCTQAIQRALESIPGVEHVSVQLATNAARVEYSPSVTTVEALKEAIESIGYEVTGENHLAVEENGISEDRLERMLHQQERQVAGRKRAFLWSLVGTCPILVITMILPHLPDTKVEQFLHQEIQIGRYKFVFEAFILWVLCTPIQFGSGWSFYKTSYYNLQQGIMGMDVLVSVGTSASYGYAVWATVTGSMEYHFFETSAVLICFILLGKWLQTLAVRRTSQALTQLLALQPKTAIQVLPPAAAGPTKNVWNPLLNSYQEHIVPLQSIQKGDLVKILKGGSIPADGVVKFGEMSVDESMITGESVPILKTQGSIVLGGTICAEAGQAAGASFVEVTGVGSATALSQIVKLVQDAQSRQVPIQNLADSIAGIFVPTVVTISVMTFMFWYAAIQSGIVPSSYLPDGESPATFSLLFGIACLVISCPCALGLATPTAVMVGTGVGAKQGILMKGGETLELASQVDSVVFDKTGTLTQGKPAITDFLLMVSDEAFWIDVLAKDPKSDSQAMGSSKQYLLWLLGSLERNSEHPLASAVVAYAEDNLKGTMPFVQPTGFTAMTGRGASGIIESKMKVAAGNRAFCQLNGISIDRQAEDTMQRMERQGKTAIIATVNGRICVVMGIADQLKADASAAIAYLRDQMGLDVWMVTGDNRRTARAIAQQLQLPMDRVIAEALPVAKVEKVQELQDQGRIVAMIGDGVNDSPALAQANVGLSLGTGAEIAAEASDMVLVKGNVADVCTALDLSQVIFLRIKLNFLWSLIYNVLSIPIAAGAFYPLIHTRLPPTVAAIAMALSSISVVGSSLALRLYKPPNVFANAAPTLDGRSRNQRQVHQSRPGISGDNEDMSEPLLPTDDVDATERVSKISQMEEGQAFVVAV